MVVNVIGMTSYRIDISEGLEDIHMIGYFDAQARLRRFVVSLLEPQVDR